MGWAKSTLRDDPTLITCPLNFHPNFDTSIAHSTQNPAAEDQIHKLKEISTILQRQLNEAQTTYKKYADRKRINLCKLKEGDKVWLIRKNIKTTRPNNKLDYRRLGPFAILEQ